jgi:hypothetical protein
VQVTYRFCVDKVTKDMYRAPWFPFFASIKSCEINHSFLNYAGFVYLIKQRILYDVSKVLLVLYSENFITKIVDLLYFW